MELKTKRTLEWIIFPVLVLILVLAGALFAYQNTYAGKIYNNISVAGVDVSGKTKKQAETLLNKKFDLLLQQDVNFVAGAKSVAAKLNDTGLGFDVSGSVNQAYAVGRSDQFVSQLYASAASAIKSTKISIPIKVDNTKLNLFISQKLPDLNISPTDARIEIKNGQVAIIPEQVGQQIDTSNLASDLSKLASGNSKEMTIKLQVISAAPDVVTQTLEDQKAQAERYVNSKITLAYGDKTYVPTAQNISSWLVVAKGSDGKQSIALDDNAIKTYLTTIAKNFEVQKKDRKINGGTNAVIEEGQPGIYLDKTKAIADIKQSLQQLSLSAITLTTYTEDPKEIKVFPAEGITPGRFDGKYIDVDLAQQKLCRIDGGTVIDCFTVSSGKASTPTPTGTRYIESKEPRRWSAPYGLWMPWWESMGEGYGIHELPEWPSGYKEGEAHLGTPVSHGCVRLGVGPAELVYNWTEIGTPVYIHK